MEYNSLTHIWINEQKFTKKDVLAQLDLPNNHLGEVLAFLKEWFSSSKDVVVQTSGSTGTPKKIAIPKQSFVESAKNTCEYFSLQPETNALLCIPVKYIGGKMMVIRAMVGGYNLWVDDPSSSPLKNNSRHIDFLAITPMQAANCLNDSPQELEQIKHILIGGGVVNSSFVNQIQSFSTQFYSTYGMTETVSHIALKKLNGPEKSTLFETLPTYSIDVNDDNCLVIYCPTLFSQPIETNDIVRLSQGGFEWLGRKDNVINSGGIKVSPERIEEQIAKLFPSTLFYITSQQDEQLGEKVLLVSQEKMEIDWEKIAIEKYEIPKEQLVRKIELTPTGKIKREKF